MPAGLIAMPVRVVAVMAAARTAVILVALTSIMLTAVSSLAATPASSAVCGNLQGCHRQGSDKNKDRYNRNGSLQRYLLWVVGDGKQVICFVPGGIAGDHFHQVGAFLQGNFHAEGTAGIHHQDLLIDTDHRSGRRSTLQHKR